MIKHIKLEVIDATQRQRAPPLSGWRGGPQIRDESSSIHCRDKTCTDNQLLQVEDGRVPTCHRGRDQRREVWETS